jgi:hypothetical protein
MRMYPSPYSISEYWIFFILCSEALTSYRTSHTFLGRIFELSYYTEKRLKTAEMTGTLK